MTIEEKKEYLQGHSAAVQMINRLNVYLEELEELKAEAHRLERLAVRSAELQKHIEQLEAFTEKIKQSMHKPAERCSCISASIESLEDERAKTLLSCRYIKGYSWEQIAEEMVYNVGTIHRIHKKALEQLEV